jgi:hypothetical protein
MIATPSPFDIRRRKQQEQATRSIRSVRSAAAREARGDAARAAFDVAAAMMLPKALPLCQQRDLLNERRYARHTAPRIYTRCALMFYARRRDVCRAMLCAGARLRTRRAAQRDARGAMI